MLTRKSYTRREESLIPLGLTERQKRLVLGRTTGIHFIRAAATDTLIEYLTREEITGREAYRKIKELQRTKPGQTYVPFLHKPPTF